MAIPENYKWKKAPMGWCCTGEPGNDTHCLEYIGDEMALIYGSQAYCQDCALKHFGETPNGPTEAPVVADDPEYFQVPEMPNMWAKWGAKIPGMGCTCYYNGATLKITDHCGNDVEDTGLYFYKKNPSTGKYQFTGHCWATNCAAEKGYMPGDTTTPTGKPSTMCLGCNVEICTVCAVCHTEGCAFIEHKVVTQAVKAKYAYLTAKTQKARGYVTLAESSLKVPKPFRIIMSEEDIEDTVRVMMGKSGFIRPCPMRPRHGFVDSRPITVNKDSAKEISDLLKKAVAADEQGHAELLLVPFIESAFNAIVTPNRIAIGPGHDGATSGHGSKDFPLVGVPFKEITPEVLSSARVDPKDDPYIEAVIQAGRQVYFTQIRAGVKIAPTVGADFVPYPIRVKEVIEASGDLLEWEAQTKLITRGTVVCHIGGTLISHYGVHCMQNDIPVFTSRRPNIGEVLEVVSKVQKPDPQAVIRGLGIGAVLPLDINGKDLTKEELYINTTLIAMMTILHNSAAMAGENGFWIGFAVAIMYRAGMAASHGEARHKLNGYAGSRETIYKLALKNFADGRNTLGHAMWKFENNNWSSGYGGRAWAKCTQSIIDMDNAVRKLYVDPTEQHVADLVGTLNNAVNQAHNGGWWLNKFITHEWFNKAAAQSLESIVVAGAAMFRALELTKDKDEVAKTAIDDWGTAPDIKVENGQLQCQIQSKSTAKVEPTPAETSKGVWAGLCNKYAVGKDPEPPDYVGVYCEICGHKFTSFNREDIDPGLVCGHDLGDGKGSCYGLVGWTQDGFFAYPFAKDIPDDEVEDVEPDQDDDDVDQSPYGKCSNCGCDLMSNEKCPDGCNTDFDSEDHATPGMVKVGLGGIPHQNINGVTISGEPAVIEVQGNFHKNYKWIHVQYKLEGIGGYKSCDLNGLKLDSSLLDLIPPMLELPSFSGSGKGYVGMKFEKSTIVDNTWRISIPELKLLMSLNVKYNGLTLLEWEGDDINGQATEETKTEGESSEQTPF